jgi:hypothetical protein
MANLVPPFLSCLLEQPTPIQPVPGHVVLAGLVGREFRVASGGPRSPVGNSSR